MIRLLYSSNAFWASSGYGVQGKSLLPRLATLPEIGNREAVAMFAWYGLQGGVHYVDGFKIYPSGFDAYGNDIIGSHTKNHGANVVISLIDVWVMKDTAKNIAPAVWCVPGDTLITLNDGHQRPIKDLYEMQPNRHVMLGHDGTRKVEGLITGYHYMGLKPTLEIETMTGRRLRTTAESGVYVKRNGDAKYIPASCVTPGDMVYCTAGNHTSIQEDSNDKLGARTHAGLAVSDRHQGNGTGVLSGDYRWRGNHKYSRPYKATSNEGAQGRTVSNLAADGTDIQYGFDADRMAAQSDRFSVQWAGQTQGEDELSSSGVGLSHIRHFDADVAVLDCQEIASPVAYRVHGVTGGALGYGTQPIIRTARSRDMADASGDELEEVRSVRSTGILEHVYDLTTSTHNFYANGMLIHNCPWLPIDHDPVPQKVLDALDGVYIPLTYAKWGHDKLKAAGVDNVYIPHGIEPSVFKIMPADSVQRFRKEVLFNPEHLTIMVAANKGYPDRKGFQFQVRAWAEFAKDKPGARLYIHTEPTSVHGGIDFAALLGDLGIKDKVVFPDRYHYFLGYPPEYMAMLYNAADVFLGASMSEGFGIPLIEAQACGTPVVTTDATSMPELVRWGSAVAPADRWWTPLNSWQYIPHAAGITEALNQLYAQWADNDRAKDQSSAELASGMIHDEYSWDVIVRDHWAPLMTRLAAVMEPAPVAMEVAA